MNPKIIVTVLLIAAVLFVIIAVKTVVPSEGASKPNILGFKSYCTFTPVSTLILLWIAVIIFTVRAWMMNGKGILGSNGVVIVLSVLLLAGIIWFSVRYAVIHSGTSKAAVGEKTAEKIKKPE